MVLSFESFVILFAGLIAAPQEACKVFSAEAEVGQHRKSQVVGKRTYTMQFVRFAYKYSWQVGIVQLPGTQPST